MLTFRNTNIIFLTALGIWFVLHTTYGIPFSILIGLLIAYSLILFYGSYYIGSGFFFKVICSGNTTGKKMAISFDDGPVSEQTIAILDTLQQYNVKAAFFCIGNRIKGNEAILKTIHQQGHLIGNHSYSHGHLFDFLSAKKMLDDLRQMDHSVQDVLSVTPRFFRPPYGVTTPGMKYAVEKGNYITVGWNIRSFDTVITDEEKLFTKVAGAIKPGAILLFHDSGKATLAVLPRIIEHARSLGYEFVRLDKLINKEAYA